MTQADKTGSGATGVDRADLAGADRADLAGAGRPASPPPDGHHADVSGGRVRPAVFGAMDGLVTNISLIAGVGGGGVAAHSIILTGAAGLMAGAISMGLGEYTSVSTQNEQVAREVDKERRELERNPRGEADELTAAWVARGLPERLAREVAVTLARNPREALRVHAQEELGVDPDEVPSPWQAAVLSFVTFAVGALIPLLPYLAGSHALWPALVAGACGLFAAGAIASRFSTHSWWASGARQLLLGMAAAGATYGIGLLIGTTAAA